MREPTRIIVKKSKRNFHAVVADSEVIGAGSGSTFEVALKEAVIDFRSERPFAKREDLRAACVLRFSR